MQYSFRTLFTAFRLSIFEVQEKLGDNANVQDDLEVRILACLLRHP